MTAPLVALVADDSPTIRGFHAAVLRAAGFAVHEAENGAAALEVLAGRDAVDLAVVDVNMPVMDGLTFLERMTDVGPRPGAVLVVSSEGDDADVLEAVRRGADWYVVKPVDAATLTDLAHRLVAQSLAPLRFEGAS